MVRDVIDGVTITVLKEIRDQRGAVLQMLRSDSLEFIGFGECYFSEISPGAIKAWKRHRLQTQQIAVPAGRVRAVIFDPRVQSPTQGELLVTELGRPDAYCRMRIPPGVWYGFQCISAGPALIANCVDLPHEPSESEFCLIDSPEIPYRWIESKGLPN